MKKAEEVKNEFFSKSIEGWEEVLQKKKNKIWESIEVYLELRRVYNSNQIILLEWLFFAFYGKGKGRLNKEKKMRFMETFTKDYGDFADVRAIVNEINKDKKSSFYYSFVTKMLNLKNDKVYPIYDSIIAQEVFGCERDSETDLNSKEECYKRIKDLYDSIDEHDNSIVAFKKIFPDSKSLGKMRILDFILYNTVE